LVQWLRLCGPTEQGVWVQSLVRELRFHMLCSVAKNNKKRGWGRGMRLEWWSPFRNVLEEYDRSQEGGGWTAHPLGPGRLQGGETQDIPSLTPATDYELCMLYPIEPLQDSIPITHGETEAQHLSPVTPQLPKPGGPMVPLLCSTSLRSYVQ